MLPLIPPFTCPVCHVLYNPKPMTDTCSLCNPTRDVCDTCMVMCEEEECNCESYCAEHIKQCANCHKQVCDDHVANCANCDVLFCDSCSVLNLDCSFCGADGCLSCGEVDLCSVCEMPYCDACSSECATCKLKMCRGHTLVLANDKNLYCQNCIDAKLAIGPVVFACPLQVQKYVDDRALKYFNPPLKLFLFNQKNKVARPNQTHDWQAEHPIPNSCFIKGTGRKGATVPGSGTYCEAHAMCFWVQDDQTQGTEHKFITDFEREFAQHCYNIGKFPSVEQWFQEMEAGWKDMILYHRDYVGPKGANPQETENLRQGYAGVAAHALRVKLQRHYFKTLKIDKTKCLTKIGFGKKTSTPTAKPKANSMFDEF